MIRSGWMIPLLAGCFLFGNARARSTLAVAPQQTMRHRTLSIRGGDLGKIEGATLAKVLSGFAGLDAVTGALIPRTSMKWFGVELAEKSLAEHYLHGIGASAATTAVSLYLAVAGETGTEKAIGYGFVARLASMTFMILTKKYHELGMNNLMFGGMWIMLAVTTYFLFSGNENALALTKVVSLLLAFHGGFLYAKPEKFAKRAKLEQDSLSRAMATIDGGYMLVSGLVTGLCASGIEPVKVAGYAALCFVPVLVKLSDVVTVDSFFGIDTGVWMIAVMTTMAAIIAGTIL